MKEKKHKTFLAENIQKKHHKVTRLNCTVGKPVKFTEK